MKTQLLQDFDESGSAAQAPAPSSPATRPSPAVWKRPQASAMPDLDGAAPGPTVQRAAPSAMGGMAAVSFAGQMRPPGGQAPAGREAQAGQSRQQAGAGAWAGPWPVPPDARVAGAGAQVHEQVHEQVRAQAAEPRAEPATDRASASDMPDWLAQRLREDAEQEAQRQRSRRMARRALGTSAVVTVLAMLGVAAYWFYQDSRVEGALDVVANTSPAVPVSPAVPAPAAVPAAVTAPAAAMPAVPDHAAVAVAASAAGAPPVAQPVAASAPEDGTSAAPPPASVGKAANDAAGGTAQDDSTPAPVQAAVARPETRQEQASRPLHRSSALIQRKPHGLPPVPVRAADDSGPTPAQRREETLMQCRVLGYDARECTRRGCMMTRFGLACPG